MVIVGTEHFSAWTATLTSLHHRRRKRNMGVGAALNTWWVAFLLVSTVETSNLGQPTCGKQAHGRSCQLGVCCSPWGYCGTGSDYCGDGCQSQCNGTTPPACSVHPPKGHLQLDEIISGHLFDIIFPARNTSFYTYQAFIQAAKSFPAFGTTGGETEQRKEIAAFFAHVTQETQGLVDVEEINQSRHYCDPTATEFPCASGQAYFGRGPLQLTWNYNYARAGQALNQPLLQNPGLLSMNATLAFETSIWFWNTASGSKPSCHDVMAGKWQPSIADVVAGRLPGFGVTTDIINGFECGRPIRKESYRVAYFLCLCEFFCVNPGTNLDCTKMLPFSSMSPEQQTYYSMMNWIS